MKTYETILYQVEEHVATVTLNRPDVHNAQNDTLRREMYDVFGALTTDEDVKVIVVTGAGDRAFSAGADIREFVAPASPTELREKRKRIEYRAMMTAARSRSSRRSTASRWAAASSWRSRATSGSPPRTPRSA